MKRQLFAGDILSSAFLVSAPASEAPPQLKPFERGSWHDILRSHAGRPTIVHFWGVTCGPCKVELPQLGEFMKVHSAIDMVTVSADLVPICLALHDRCWQNPVFSPRRTGFSTMALSSG